MHSLTKTKILLIVEGEFGEKNFYNRLEELTFGEKTAFEFFLYKTNIYQLYSELNKLEFDADIIDVLKTSPRHNDNEKDILNNKFAYKYLVFDLDFQDTRYDCKYNILHKMIEYFSDETDNGKLYVNYPMLESYRDMKYIGDEEYYQRSISITETKRYKSIVDQRGNTLDINRYTWNNYLEILKMNIKKANYITIKKLIKGTYKNYQDNLTQEKICIKQEMMIKKNGLINVLNCGIFFLLDYFGENLFNKT